MSAVLMNLANVAFLASFLARDVLWLRVACMLGALLLCASFLATEPPTVTGLAWQGLFLAIHGYWVARLWRERRPVPLSADERRLADASFPTLSPREVALLCRAGAWRSAEAGGVLCEQGAPVGRLLLLVDGEAVVERDGVEVARLPPGRFVGEVAWLLGGPASAAVRAPGPVRWLEWPGEELRALLAAHPAVHGALQRALGADLAQKVARTPR